MATSTKQRQTQRRIFILGTGSIGKFLAYAMRSCPPQLPNNAPQPITLLFHRPGFLRDLPKAPQNPAHESENLHLRRLGIRPNFVPRRCDITLKTSRHEQTQGPFEAELVLPERRPDVAKAARYDLPSSDEAIERYPELISDEPIAELVVCVKAHQTVSALRSIKPRLTPDSTILFMQNGMGTVEEVNEKVWPEDEATERPHYMVGVNSHGIHATGPFSATHAGKGVIYLGVVPPVSGRLRYRTSATDTDADLEFAKGDESVALPETSRHLLRALTRVPLLAATPLPPTALHMAQLEKLAVNCVVNPLTVLLDARNDSILHNYALTRVMRLLLAEISLVFVNLPELRGVPGVRGRFAVERLEALVVAVAGRTGANLSSMLQDVRRGARTEVDYLNGYVVRRAEEGLRRRREGKGPDEQENDDELSEERSRGFSPVMNYLVMNLVKGKQGMISREVDNYSPFDAHPGGLPLPKSSGQVPGDGGPSKL